ncbi:MAG: hypothetical protein ACYCYI_04750 [Saccharofermentanales bacterium]
MPEYLFLKDAIAKISDGDFYYEINQKVKQADQIDPESFYYLFEIQDDEAFKAAIFSLSKSDIEMIMYLIPKLMTKFNESRISALFKIRYRKFMFRILYIHWQDNYEKTRFRNLFLYVLNLPKSEFYVDEVHFSIETLITLAKSKDKETKFAELARSARLSMREFLDLHKIRRDSLIAIEVMSIFFLFCNSQDYIDLGSDRLIIALKNAEMRNQAKILINMVKTLSVDERIILKDAFQYFNLMYYNTGGQINDEFWNLIPEHVFKIALEEFVQDGFN